MNDAGKPPQPDKDANLGAVEDDYADPSAGRSQNSMAGQLGHRDQDDLLKESDSDFPEPDAVEEHTGEPS